MLLTFWCSKDFLKLTPKYETVNLMEAIQMPLQCMQSIQDKIPIALDPFPIEIATHIITDRQWLQENLFCLLSNAVKYSAEGMVTIRVSLVRDFDPLSTTSCRHSHSHYPSSSLSFMLSSSLRLSSSSSSRVHSKRTYITASVSHSSRIPSSKDNSNNRSSTRTRRMTLEKQDERDELQEKEQEQEEEHGVVSGLMDLFRSPMTTSSRQNSVQNAADGGVTGGRVGDVLYPSNRMILEY